MRPIAVLGLGCHLPGGETPEAFWDTLRAGRCLIRSATAADLGAEPANLLGDPGARIGFAAPSSLPGERPDFAWPAHVARRALADSGLASVGASRRGVILAHYAWAATAGTRAVATPIYARALGIPMEPPGAAEGACLSSGVVAALVSEFRLSGPCYAIDAACASFQFALKLAGMHLDAGDADEMLVAAANAGNAGFMAHLMAGLQALDKTGRSRPFGANASGLTLADGAVAVLVGRAADRWPRVRGIIRGIGLASDGRGENLTAPNPKGQLAACRRAYAEAGVAPESIDFIECHATGTQVGDRVELASIRAVMGGRAPALGAVKGQIGHVMAASGGAGLAKLLLALEHGVIPPTPGVSQPVETGLSISAGAQAWPVSAGPRRGALNSFGFGGANAHLILEAPGEAFAPALEARAEVALAITGMAVCAGPWADLDAFAAACYQGRAGFRPLPPARWRGMESDATLLSRLGFEDGAPPEGAYLEAIEVDPLRMRLPPNDLATLNPQQLLMLKVGDAALRDAGVAPGGRVAVIIAMDMEQGIGRIDARLDLDGWMSGLSPRDASAARRALHEAPTASDLLSCVGNVMAGRIASAWDFSGPAFTLSAGGAGVAHALAAARLMLESGEAEAVLVGAVDLAGGIENLAARLLGRPAPMGWRVGEGAAAIVLRPVAKDVSSYAIIAGLAVSRACGAACASAAMAAAGIATDKVGYVEAPAGAAAALESAYPATARIALSDIATIAGDCGTAGDLLALTRAALAVAHRFLPGEPANHGVGPMFQSSPDHRPWLAPAGGCFAGVWLGDGATNGHAALTESTRARTRPRLIEIPFVIPVAGVDGAEIAARLMEIAAALRGGARAEDIERAAVDRLACEPELPYAACLVGADAAALATEAARIAEVAETTIKQRRAFRTPAGGFLTGEPIGPGGKTAFIYSGVQGAYPGQCRDVMQLTPGLGAEWLRGFPDPRKGLDEKYLFPANSTRAEDGEREAADTRLAANPAMQVVIGITAAYMNTRLATGRLGLRPDVALGYSLGEISMLCASGAWVFDERLLSQLQSFNGIVSRLAGPDALWPDGSAWDDWAQYAVAAPASDIAKAIAGAADIHMPLVNSPNEVTLVGPRGTTEKLLAALDVDWMRLPARLALHCEPAGTLAASLTHCCEAPIGARPEHRLMFSGGDGPLEWTTRAVAERLTAGLVGQVDFPRLINAAWDEGARLFVEIGPGNACARWIDASLAGKPRAVMAMGRRGVSEPTAVAQCLAMLVSHRRRFDLKAAIDRAESPAPSAVTRLVVLGGEPVRERYERFKAEPESPLGKPTPVAPSVPKLRLVAPSAPARFPAPRVVPPNTPGIVPSPGSGRALAAAIAASQSAGHLAYLRQRTRLALALADGNALDLADEPASTSLAASRPREAPPPALYTQADIIELSDGRISAVFGPDYEPIDHLPFRLRMASQPFTSITRITALSGQRGVFGAGRIVTEYDVTPGNFFLVGDSISSQIPLDGQGVLFLLAWLGIDFENQGTRRLRWLDAKTTYTGDMPRIGETLIYDIRLTNTFTDGNTRVLSFDVEGEARDQAGNIRPVFRNSDSQVGFFSMADLERGAGVADIRFEDGPPPASPFLPPLPPPPNGLDLDGLTRLTRGDLSALSPLHVGPGNPLLRLPEPVVLMLDRIVHWSSVGGVHGKGLVLAERCADPNHWATRTHFRHDELLSGPCFTDAMLQMMRATALAFGMHLGLSGARFEPLPNRIITNKFRRQVLPNRQILTFRLDIADIGMTPEPYIVGDVSIIDGPHVCGVVNGIGVMLAGGGRT